MRFLFQKEKEVWPLSPEALTTVTAAVLDKAHLLSVLHVTNVLASYWKIFLT